MKTRKIVCILLAVLLLGSVLPVTAGAIDLIDEGMDGKAKLTVSCIYNDGTAAGVPLVGVNYDIYRIADPDVNAYLTPVGVYGEFLAEHGYIGSNGKLIPLSNKSQQGERSQWEELAKLLGDNIDSLGKPTASGKTLETGKVTFEKLELGLYLVVCQKHEQGGYTYEQDAALIMVPNRDQDPNAEDIDTWDYTVEMVDKPIVAKGMLHVKKIWDDGNNAARKRPKTLKIYLYKNGVKQEDKTVILPNEDGKWEHTWEDLELGPKWTVAEETGELYKLHYVCGTPQQNGIYWTITNKYSPPPPPKLPQTGQLWWPVPVLVSLGMLCMLIGLIRRRGEKHET